MRKKRLILNTTSSVLQQVVVIICGFILPRFFLQYYGSDVNGLVSSISQFLGFISFMQLGVGAVVQSAWYKPLAEKNNDEISRIYVSAERFFKRIAIIFIIYTIVLCLIIPYTVKDEFGFLYAVSTIIAISISLFIQYYFGLTNQLLLNADQRAYVNLILQIFIVIGNTVGSVILIKLGMGVQIVKLVSSFLYALNPIIMVIYVKHKYNINKKIKIYNEPIKQKWNGFAQHLASVIMDNTDVMILTIFSSLTNVSIYYVYHLVVYGIRQLITSLTVGIQSLLGHLLALGEKNTFEIVFDKTELLFHVGITFLYTCVTILICPFVIVYTMGVNDANYYVPVFATIISMAFATYCIRLPYYAVIKAAGHYKETQVSAYIEMILNLTISIFAVVKYGLIGVAIGTLIASIYRTVYFVYYLSKNIIRRPIKKALKMILLDICVFSITLLLTQNIQLEIYSYLGWIMLAAKVAMLCLGVIIVVYSLGASKQVVALLRNLKIKKK